VKASLDSVGPLRKYAMWHEVHRLQEQGLNKSQISKELDMDRGSVRKYLRMSEEEFLSSESYKRQYDLKLDDYETFVVEQLKQFPYLSAAQIEDKLKEHYGIDTINACSKTIFNFVARVRDRYDIPKPPGDTPRPYEMQEEVPFGEYAQVDFGERYMSRMGCGHVKVYFFVMVLCRSRYKYVFYSLKPFSSALANYAHELAFQYFGGIPKKLIYDQDKVFIKDENLGEYLLTQGFRTFVNEHHFETIFCRKSDPESKGKVENVVKYVKYNFLSGRLFEGEDKLNSDGLLWLERTGNGKIHAGTHLIPAEVFKEEQTYLSPYYGTPMPPEVKMDERMVRKDNVINWHCVYYRVPTGTYTGTNSIVLVEVKEGQLFIYDKESGKTIAQHTISNTKGTIVGDGSYRRDRTSSYTDLENQIRAYLGESDLLDLYLQKLHDNKPRYYRDNLCHIIRHMDDISTNTLMEAISTNAGNNCYHAATLIDSAKSIQKKKGEPQASTQHALAVYAANKESLSYTYNSMDLSPAKSDINSYNAIFNGM